MKIEHSDIMLSCESEKERVGIAWSTYVEKEDIYFDNTFEIDFSTMQEAFWENYHEYKSGI